MGLLTKVYLVSYNVLQCVGWTILLYRFISNLSQPEHLYAEAGGLLKCLLTSAFLEVLHAATGNKKYD